jgi:hypothetical protein
VIPIELLIIVLWVAFVLVGLSRQFQRELGATIGFVAMMLILDLAGRFALPMMTGALPVDRLSEGTATPTWLLYSGIILATVFIVYEGEGLAYGGNPPRGILGALLSGFVGALNGWLVVGTWWYYTDQLGYPIQKWGLYTPPLSELAQRLLSLTPMALIPDERSWLFLTLFLVFLLVLKVVR